MIVRTPDTCGGRARIDGTRLAVWWVITMTRWEEDYQEEDFLFDFPSMTHQDILDAHEYYAANKSEIDQDLKDQNCE